MSISLKKYSLGIEFGLPKNTSRHQEVSAQGIGNFFSCPCPVYAHFFMIFRNFQPQWGNRKILYIPCPAFSDLRGMSTHFSALCPLGTVSPRFQVFFGASTLTFLAYAPWHQITTISDVLRGIDAHFSRPCPPNTNSLLKSYTDNHRLYFAKQLPCCKSYNNSILLHHPQHHQCPVPQPQQPACENAIQNHGAGDGKNLAADSEDLSFLLEFDCGSRH